MPREKLAVVAARYISSRRLRTSEWLGALDTIPRSVPLTHHKPNAVARRWGSRPRMNHRAGVAQPQTGNDVIRVEAIRHPAARARGSFHLRSEAHSRAGESPKA